MPSRRNSASLAAALVLIVFSLAAAASSPALAQQPTPAKPDSHISPDQAKALFKSIDELIDFASKESGLPVQHEVKRRLVTRAEIQSDLRKKMDEDKDAKRMQRSELVIKKFGMLDRDFNLQPFLLSLLPSPSLLVTQT